MNNINTMRYVGLQQPTSVPTGYQQSAASPDATSTISRNGFWPMSGAALNVVAAPMGQAVSPTDNLSVNELQVTTLRRG